MTYREAEAYIFSFINESRSLIPRKEQRKQRLTHMRHFLAFLHHPEKRIPHYIHITGTSGKGSVASFLASIVSASDQSVGLMTSPHPTYLYERWRVDGRTMSKKEFVDIISHLRPIISAYQKKYPNNPLTFITLVTAIGFLFFARKKVSWAIIEVGIGGRYDRTNVLPRTDIAIITNIKHDHHARIGPTKNDIAYEKAGIIAKKSRVFTMEKNKALQQIIHAECTKQHGSSLTVSPVHKKPIIKTTHFSGTEFTYNNSTYTIRTLGSHQVFNACLAIDVAESLNIPYASIRRGLRHTRQPLRMELMKKNPYIILDSAHNLHKIQSTVRTIQDLRTHLPEQSNIHLIVGFSKKNHRAMMKELLTLNPASVSHVKNIQFPTKRNTCAVAQCKSKEEALRWSIQRAKKHDILLITGSIFFSGTLRPILKK